MAVTAQKHTEVVEGRDNTRQLDTVDQENSERVLVLADSVEKQVLKVLRAFSHDFSFAGHY